MTNDTAADNRTAATLVRQYDQLEKIKRNLIRQGQLHGNATPQAVVEKLREIIPPGLWANK